MSTPPASSELLTRIDDAWRSFRAAVSATGHRALARTGAGGWTLGAHVAHVAAWEALAAGRLAAYRAMGARTPAPEPDAFNAAAARAAAARPAEELVAELDTTHAAFREAVAALDDRTLAADDGWAAAVIAGSSFDHYAEHRDVLVAARPATVAALRAAVEDEWRDLRAAVRDLGRAGLADAASGEWTYRDLLAHLVGWMELVPRRLAEIRGGTYAGLAGPEGIDAFNARAVAERRLVGPEAIVDELDAAHRLVLKALDGLSDADVADRRVFNVLAFTTYRHFEEHRSELRAGGAG